MIAQEVEQVFPEWVGTDAEGYKTLTYRGFEALTVESLREIQAENDHLRADKETLTAEVAALQADKREIAGKLASLEERVAAIEKRGAPQHASMVGDGRWALAVLLGASLGLGP